MVIIEIVFKLREGGGGGGVPVRIELSRQLLDDSTHKGNNKKR